MSENTANNKNVSDDEIDLLDLFRRMGRTLSRLFHALGKAFLISIVFLLRRWFPLLLSIALGIGATYLIKMSSESSFTSDLELRSNTVPASDMISYINRLHTYCVEQNMTALSNALVLENDQLKNIIDICAFWIIDKGKDGIPDLIDYDNSHNIYDTLNIRMNDRLDIRVKIHSAQELNMVGSGLIKFINKDSLFQQKNRVRIRQNNEMLIRLTYDIKQLDSLQKFKYFEETKNFQPKNGGQMVFLQEHQTQLVFPEIQNLYIKKQAYETERDLYKGIVTTLSEFSIPAKRSNGGIFYGRYVIPIFFFVTLLLLILIANRRKLEETFNKY